MALAVAPPTAALLPGTYVVIGDGESQRRPDSGKPPCSALYHKVDNICVIEDYNKIQLDGWVKDIMDVAPLSDKWRSFGWHTIEIDGNDFPRRASLRSPEAAATKGKLHRRSWPIPSKRKGVSFHGEQSQIPRNRAHSRRSRGGA